MAHKKISVGDVIKLHQKYDESAKIALVLQIEKSEFHGKAGWISFDFTVMNELGQILHISESCIEEVINTNQSPSTWLHSNCLSN